MKNLLSSIPYKSLDLWDVKRYSKKSFDSSFQVDFLGKHIISETEKIMLSDFPEVFFSILGISNEVGMYDAYDKKGKEFNQPYKIVKDGFIAYNPYRVNVGSIGIKTTNLKGNLISPAYVVFSCKKTLLPEFLFLLMKTEMFNKQVIDNTSGSVRQNLTFNALARIRIPVPSIEEQKNLLERYYLLIEQAKLAQIHCSWTAIDGILDRFLGIVSSNNSRKDGSCLLNIPFSSLLTWDVKNRQENILFETDKYKSVMLASLVDFNPSLTKKLNSNAVISFVPMECVSDFDGTVTEYRECSFGSKGFTKFEDGDIIWAKITPCMQNGKSAIVNNMQNGVGYGSTEFYVIRRKSDKVLTEYLYYILRSERVRKEAINYFSGSAGQQRVRKSFLRELNIPLPSLKEQQELVMLLNNEKKEINEKKKEFENLLLKAKQDFQSAIFS